VRDKTFHSIKPLLYVTFDSLQEGVGASQVLQYLRLLQDRRKITLLTFEKDTPPQSLVEELSQMKIDWRPLPFGNNGFWGGLYRVSRLLRFIKRCPSQAIHARGDLACISAILAGRKEVLWDCRAITPEQRIYTKNKSKFSWEYVILRLIEYICATKSKHIIVITSRAKLFFIQRYGLPDSKFSHISTCVDLNSFKLNRMRSNRSNDLRILLSGSYGNNYDIELLSKMLAIFRKHANVFLGIASPKNSQQQAMLLKPDKIFQVTHDQMPLLISNFDVGFGAWRKELSEARISAAATKNAEFLASGKPIIVDFEQGDIGALVEKHSVGVSIAQYDHKYIGEKCEFLMNLIQKDKRLSDRCRSIAKKYYNLNDAVSLLSQIYTYIE
jgi:glycosyltransferase involved in cell wall biosynthesis